MGLKKRKHNAVHECLLLFPKNSYLFNIKLKQSLMETQNYIINVAFYLEARGMKEKKKEINPKSMSEQTKISSLTVTSVSDQIFYSIIGFDTYSQSCCLVFR